MIRYTVSMLFLLFHSGLFSQQPNNASLLEIDSSWSRETFFFPINFAPEINYKGMEEAVFPPGWGRKDSADFWSYAFAWKIDHPATLTKNELENNLKVYFEGLMKSVSNGDKEAIAYHTTAHFFKKEDVKGISRHTGNVYVFDAFFTKKPLTLNVLVEQHHCVQQQRSIVFFRLSPKAFEHEVWVKLNGLKLRVSSCDN